MGTMLRPMRARDAAEEHRASTPLELFFDLTFVVAVSLAAVGLAHEIEDGHAASGVGVFAMVFFAVWWGWLNFTWFASAYDTDDWLYRIVTLVQMGGALTVAAGVPKVFDHEDFRVVVVGYVIMRLAMVCQWLRAARNDPDRRLTALTYAFGITVLQALWVARLALPDDLGVASFLVLLVGEISVPALAERRATTSFHPGHVAERYGLFTIIVLGEGVLATANSIIEALDEGEHAAPLVTLAIGGLALLAAMWWLYFTVEPVEQFAGYRQVFAWGYGHYGIFAAAAAVSSGIEVQVAGITGDLQLGDLGARLATAVPTALFVVLVWALVLRPGMPRSATALLLVGVAGMLAVGIVPVAPEVATLLEAALVGLVVAGVVVRGAAANAPARALRAAH